MLGMVVKRDSIDVYPFPTLVILTTGMAKDSKDSKDSKDFIQNHTNSIGKQFKSRSTM